VSADSDRFTFDYIDRPPQRSAKALYRTGVYSKGGFKVFSRDLVNKCPLTEAANRGLNDGYVGQTGLS